ncbi:DUF2180 family protein [Streptomyces sp. NPDC046984]|uniref:DUF2180 family protein n=1 Tax=Streptomyces sp. NPDC046984 TaxID=3155138 RepID=UPI0033F7F397
MDCYDCHMNDQATAAVGVCRSCGAGICPTHAHAIPQTLHHLTGTGVATRIRAARYLLCTTCLDAERSA